MLTGAALWAASCANKDQGADPVPQVPPVQQTGLVLKVMSYNIHHANPPARAGVIDLEAVANAIRARDPDLVALQEVDVNTTRSGPFNQAGELAQKLGMHFFFGKAIDYEGGAYGVAILSKFPISESSVHPLPTKAGSNAEPRVLARARVQLPDGTFLRFGSTHLDAQSDQANRLLQAEEIGRLAAAEQLPFVLGGDFNATPEATVMTNLDKYFRRSCYTCGPTIPASQANKTIDYLLFAPASRFAVLGHQVVQEKLASDHLPVEAQLRLLP